MKRLVNAAVTLAAVAVGIRIAWSLIAPLFAPIVLVACLLGILSLAIGRR